MRFFKKNPEVVENLLLQDYDFLMKCKKQSFLVHDEILIFLIRKLSYKLQKVLTPTI